MNLSGLDIFGLFFVVLVLGLMLGFLFGYHVSEHTTAAARIARTDRLIEKTHKDIQRLFEGAEGHVTALKGRIQQLERSRADLKQENNRLRSKLGQFQKAQKEQQP